MSKEPTFLIEAIAYFQSPDNCREYLVPRRWPNGVTCPTCGSEKVTFQPKHNRWQCTNRHPRRQFTLKTGTVMEDSPIRLDKWLTAMWLVASNRNGISSWELHRALDVTQKTAWFLLHRVRLAMQDDLTGGNLGGEVEVDETYIGGKARNMRKDRKTRGRTKATMQPIIGANVEPGTQVYSDEHGDQWRMAEYEHSMVNHLETYVDGNVHTNGIENFWSLLKRTIGGTYVSVEPFHLFRYVDEQAFRYFPLYIITVCP